MGAIKTTGHTPESLRALSDEQLQAVRDKMDPGGQHYGSLSHQQFKADFHTRIVSEHNARVVAAKRANQATSRKTRTATTKAVTVQTTASMLGTAAQAAAGARRPTDVRPEGAVPLPKVQTRPSTYVRGRKKGREGAGVQGGQAVPTFSDVHAVHTQGALQALTAGTGTAAEIVTGIGSGEPPVVTALTRSTTAAGAGGPFTATQRRSTERRERRRVNAPVESSATATRVEQAAAKVQEHEGLVAQGNEGMRAALAGVPDLDKLAGKGRSKKRAGKALSVVTEQPGVRKRAEAALSGPGKLAEEAEKALLGTTPLEEAPSQTRADPESTPGTTANIRRLITTLSGKGAPPEEAPVDGAPTHAMPEEDAGEAPEVPKAAPVPSENVVKKGKAKPRKGRLLTQPHAADAVELADITKVPGYVPGSREELMLAKANLTNRGTAENPPAQVTPANAQSEAHFEQHPVFDVPAVQRDTVTAVGAKGSRRRDVTYEDFDEKTVPGQARTARRARGEAPRTQDVVDVIPTNPHGSEEATASAIAAARARRLQDAEAGSVAIRNTRSLTPEEIAYHKETLAMRRADIAGSSEEASSSGGGGGGASGHEGEPRQFGADADPLHLLRSPDLAESRAELGAITGPAGKGVFSEETTKLIPPPSQRSPAMSVQRDPETALPLPKRQAEVDLGAGTGPAARAARKAAKAAAKAGAASRLDVDTLTPAQRVTMAVKNQETGARQAADQKKLGLKPIKPGRATVPRTPSRRTSPRRVEESQDVAPAPVRSVEGQTYASGRKSRVLGRQTAQLHAELSQEEIANRPDTGVPLGPNDLRQGAPMPEELRARALREQETAGQELPKVTIPAGLTRVSALPPATPVPAKALRGGVAPSGRVSGGLGVPLSPSGVNEARGRTTAFTRTSNPVSNVQRQRGRSSVAVQRAYDRRKARDGAPAVSGTA